SALAQCHLLRISRTDLFWFPVPALRVLPYAARCTSNFFLYEVVRGDVCPSTLKMLYREKRRQASPPVRDLGATKVRHKPIGSAAFALHRRLVLKCTAPFD